MRRRELIAAAAGISLWPLVARAEDVKLRHVGILVLGNPDSRVFLTVFKEAMLADGYIEGRTVAFDVRSAGSRTSALPDLAADLVRSKVDVIVGYLTPTVQAAK